MKRILIILLIITLPTTVSTQERIYDFSKLRSIGNKILPEDRQLDILLTRYITQTEKNGNGAVYFRLDESGRVIGNGMGFDEKIEIAKEKALNDCQTFNNSKNCYLIAVNDKIVFTGKVNNFYLHRGNLISKNEYLSLNTLNSVNNSQLYENEFDEIDETVNKVEISKTAEEKFNISVTKVKLRELKSMLDEGLISQEQYNEKSSNILEDF